MKLSTILENKNQNFEIIKDIILHSFKEDLSIDKKLEEALNMNYHKMLELSKQKKIYGINTGLGPFVEYENHIKAEDLIEHLRISTNEYCDDEIVQLTMLFRIIVLSQGYSGISSESLKYYTNFYNYHLLPLVPILGSLGASGDLIPLSFLTASILGKPNSYIKYNDKIHSSKKIINKFGFKKPVFHKREILAFINGLSHSKAFIFYGILHLELLFQLIHEFYILSYVLLNANLEHIDDNVLRLMNLKHISMLIQDKNQLLNFYKNQIELNFERRLQEIYSIRCGYQILGAVHEKLIDCKEQFSREIFLIDDNPILENDIYHTGNFFGQNLAFIADILNMITTQLGVWIDRWISTLLNPKYNNMKLMLSNKEESSFGLGGLEILSTALTAELRSNSNMHSTFSIPTNGNNQDITPHANLSGRKSYYQLKLLTVLVVLLGIVILSYNEHLKDYTKKNISQFTKYIQKFFIKYFRNIKNHHQLIKKIEKKIYNSIMN